MEVVRQSAIPIEVCPTSNLMTLGIQNLSEHPILKKIEGVIPFSVNTDDTALFRVSLSQEIASVAKELQWRKEEVISFTRGCVCQVLERDPVIMDFLREKVEQFANHLNSN